MKEFKITRIHDELKTFMIAADDPASAIMQHHESFGIDEKPEWITHAPHGMLFALDKNNQISGNFYVHTQVGLCDSGDRPFLELKDENKNFYYVMLTKTGMRVIVELSASEIAALSPHQQKEYEESKSLAHPNYAGYAVAAHSVAEAIFQAGIMSV